MRLYVKKQQRYKELRLVPTYILPAKEIRPLGKFQPNSFKNERLVCVETNGPILNARVNNNYFIVSLTVSLIATC